MSKQPDDDYTCDRGPLMSVLEIKRRRVDYVNKNSNTSHAGGTCSTCRLIDECPFCDKTDPMSPCGSIYNMCLRETGQIIRVYVNAHLYQKHYQPVDGEEEEESDRLVRLIELGDFVYGTLGQPPPESRIWERYERPRPKEVYVFQLVFLYHIKHMTGRGVHVGSEREFFHQKYLPALMRYQGANLKPAKS